MTPTLELNESNFDSAVSHSDVPVVVDFWAEWCGPCKMLAPLIDEVAGESRGTVTFAKVNIDDHPRLAQRFDIRSIPTLLFFEGGQLRDQAVGVVSKKILLNKLAALRTEPPHRHAA